MSFNSDVSYWKSPFVQIICDGNMAVIWHSLFGFPKMVTLETIKFLESLSKPATFDSLGYEFTREDEAAIGELVHCHYLIPSDFDDRAFLKEKMDVRRARNINGALIDYLELIMSEVCNFRCIYCIHFSNLETSDRINNSEKLMRFGMAKDIVDRYIDILRRNKRSVADINFGGGEPLIAWDVIKQVLDYCNAVYGKEFEFHFSINTNASLLTTEIASCLKAYSVDIASSLDGLMEGNDLVRLTKFGGSTFPQIIRGFEVLAAVGYPVEGIAVTVTEKNFDYLDTSIIDWAAARGMKDVRIDIDVIGMVNIPIEKIVSRLMLIRTYAGTLGIDVPGFWSRTAENLNDSTLENDVSFCGSARGNSICVGPSGNIYGCGYSTTQFGDISDVQSLIAADSVYSRFVSDHMPGTIEMCKGCMIEGHCSGGCTITHEFANATDNTSKIDRMCEFYRRMTQELLIAQLRAATVQ